MVSYDKTKDGHANPKKIRCLATDETSPEATSAPSAYKYFLTK